MAKLLWISPYSMHDTSSGAALQCRIMLQQLAKRGVEVKALGSFIFDNPSGKSMFTDLEEKLKGEEKVFNLHDEGIEYIYVRCEDTAIHKWNYDEQMLWYSKFQEIIRVFKPDVVMGFGGDCASMAARAELQRRGIPVVYVVCNGNHKSYSFYDCDMVLTDSKATAAFYGNNFGINVLPMGQFIIPEHVIAEKKEPKYVTLINPAPAKGVSLFARLALMAQKELPDVRFLSIKSRGDFAASVQALHLPDSEEKPFTMEQFKNVDRAEHMSNVKPIYAATKVLVIPSLLYESWGRVVTEAILNGIPVLSSTMGGLPEAVGEGGICLDVPVECQKDLLRMPTEEEMRPWMDALKRLLTEDWTSACEKAAKQHDINVYADRVMEYLKPLFDRKASYNSQYYRSGMGIR